MVVCDFQTWQPTKLGCQIVHSDQCTPVAQTAAAALSLSKTVNEYLEQRSRDTSEPKKTLPAPGIEPATFQPRTFSIFCQISSEFRTELEFEFSFFLVISIF